MCGCRIHSSDEDPVMPNWDYFLDVLCWGHSFLSLTLDLSKFLLLLPCVILCGSEIYVCVCVYAHFCTYMLEMGGYKEAGIRSGSVATENGIGR